MIMLVQNIYNTVNYTQNIANSNVFQEVTIQHFSKIYADMSQFMNLVWQLAQNENYLHEIMQRLFSGCAQQQMEFSELPQIIFELRREGLQHFQLVSQRLERVDAERGGRTDDCSFDGAE